MELPSNSVGVVMKSLTVYTLCIAALIAAAIAVAGLAATRLGGAAAEQTPTASAQASSMSTPF